MPNTRAHAIAERIDAILHEAEKSAQGLDHPLASTACQLGYLTAGLRILIRDLNQDQ